MQLIGWVSEYFWQYSVFHVTLFSCDHRVFFQRAFFVHVISKKLQLSLRVPRLEQGLLSNTTASHVDVDVMLMTVDTDSCLPAASDSNVDLLFGVFC